QARRTLVISAASSIGLGGLVGGWVWFVGGPLPGPGPVWIGGLVVGGGGRAPVRTGGWLNTMAKTITRTNEAAASRAGRARLRDGASSIGVTAAGAVSKITSGSGTSAPTARRLERTSTEASYAAAG